jgi:hypothetical protein
VEKEMHMQKALLAQAASFAKATRAKAAANAAAMASTFESDSSMDAEPTDVASRLLTSLKAPILKSSMKKLGKKVPRAKTVSLKKASISSPKKASSPSNLMTPSKQQPKLKDPPVPSTLTSSALIPSFSTPVNLLPSVPMAPMSEAAPSLGVGSTNVATPKDIDAFWEAMHQTSATPPPVSHEASPFNLVLEGQDTWMSRVENVDSASSISSAPSIGIEFVSDANENEDASILGDSSLFGDK